ncbi:MAG: tripartite tricarboxylate transporter substrate binding protein BugD [Betaproteobacteria bacterium]|jgi:tripartite-type tricarboxylate transporter receptor subunit TctC|nr:tripartite tricarboxylate transporter substrate binding protein BugD [Betaproteobacteria bacterium]
MKFKRLISAAVIGTAFAASSAFAFPDREIKVVVPFTAGGPTDVVARTMAEAMRKHLNSPVVVENLDGAGGTRGPSVVSKAKPDGHTVLIHHIGMSTAPALYRKLPYNPMTDFEHIGLINEVPMTFVARKDFPAATMKEFIQVVKKDAKKWNLANAGLGAASHLCGMLFQSALDTDLTTVPYKGTGPAMTDLMGGQVDFMCDQTTNTTERIKAGSVKGYAVTTKTRLKTDGLSNLPTVAESGLPNFEVTVWHGLYAPKGTPKAALDKLNAALNAALKDPEVIKRFEALGTGPVSPDKATATYHAKFLQSQIDLWGPIIKKAGQFAD